MTTIAIEESTANIKIAYFGTILSSNLALQLENNFRYISFSDNLSAYLAEQSLLTLPDVIIMEVGGNDESLKQVAYIKQHPVLKNLITILIGLDGNEELRKKSLNLKVNDYYAYPFPMEDFFARINFLVKFKSIKPRMLELPRVMEQRYRMPVSKRIFDVIASGFALLLLSPLFIVIAILIKLESKGKVIYKSKRVGAAYKIFDFYKFRSMRSDADKMLNDLAALNQYANEGDNKNGKSAFVKFNNDPRITRLGKILRKTSIDELPQLINVFIGDMSLVGNRPLPLYEAEQLTTDRWSTRFNGPAGLTGLWQISRRGHKNMSESERKELDNYYANHYSIFLDMKIIIKTIPALIQKEQV
ncbi:sugar transferase [Pedobacter frigidisoli]|uniref:Sugar transferase n=1 Tax=Pedobacter frigidisoli TaxID=2530455 RepID=A0A4R0NP22_9SPHI|nr:sugar transferase [Pedobacter frigidisoli]TCD01989.1 sugar transferase [Pedobacter frigidisoli]